MYAIAVVPVVRHGRRLTAAFLASQLMMFGFGAQAQTAQPPQPVQPEQTFKPVPPTGAPRIQDGLPSQESYSVPSVIGPSMTLTTGKSTLLRLEHPIDRVSVGNPGVADVTLINPRELYLLGKSFGSTNVILWRKGGQTTAMDVSINIDAGLLQDKLLQLMPEEKGIRVSAAADSVVLAGMVSSSLLAQQAVSIADAYVRNINRGLVLPVLAGDGMAKAGTAITIGQSPTAPGAAVNAAGARVINLLTVFSPQQVMLEVKVAEVSRTLLDKLGAQVSGTRTSGNWAYSILTGFLSNAAGVLDGVRVGGTRLTLDAARQNGLIKILAEPNIIAMSGQEGSFLSGGKVFIPTANTSQGGFPVITLTEKEFGVGLKFTPTVLSGGLIHLKVGPEVSELSQTGSPFTSINGITSILPSFVTRRAETSVQLYDGQSLAIAGLIRSNVTETVKRFPVLGELPVLGALFRSSEFQSDETELMFLITPRLVKAMANQPLVPTDNFVPPSRTEFFLDGRMEGTAPAAAPESIPATR